MNKYTGNPTEQLSGYRKRIPQLYLVALVVIAVMVCSNILLKEPNIPDQYGLGNFTVINTGWHTAEGIPFETAEIDDLRSDGTETVSIFYSLPTTMDRDESIVFRSKNCTVTVRVGAEQVYASEVATAPFYNHSPGTRWNFVSIGADDAGKTVELQVQQAYQDGRAKVDNFYYGDRASITLYLINDKILGGVISLLMFFVAILFLSAWVVLNWHRNPKDYSLLWLGVFAVVASCWCLLETNVLQFFVSDLQILQVLDNLMLVLGGLPLFLYMDSVYQVFRHRFIRILCGLNVAYILLATVSQIFGLWDYHETLNGAILSYGVVVVILVVCIVRQRNAMRFVQNKKERVLYAFRQAGILLLGLGLLGDLVRYLLVDVLDRAYIIRIGLLCFIICFGIGNIYHMILLVKKGMEADLISRLAYKDGLTNTGNRTAYLEELQRLAKNFAGDGLGIVMFDVNDLKVVNDTLGHKEGDRLLLTCANLLREVFCEPWVVYRIGGDEFVALLHGRNVETAYAGASARLTEMLAQINSDEREYPVLIAHGASFCTEITQDNIEAVEKDADLRMYQNKYQLKRERKGTTGLTERKSFGGTGIINGDGAGKSGV